MTKTKFINNSNIWPIQECISTFLLVWVKYFSDHFVVSDFAPYGIRACSIDTAAATAEEQLRVWELQHSLGDDGTQSNNDAVQWWKIVIELRSLCQDEVKSPARPRLNRKGGTGIENYQSVRSSLQGYSLAITLYSSNPVDLHAKDSFVLETNLKKFFNDTSYQLILQILSHCELPKFDHDGKTFKEMYQINAKVNFGIASHSNVFYFF